MTTPTYRLAILDLDGVITQTARLHAKAWEQMFDAYLEERDKRAGEDHSPFNADEDYDEYVDGKRRYDDVRLRVHDRGHWLSVHLTDEQLTVFFDRGGSEAVDIGFLDEVHEMTQGETRTFDLKKAPSAPESA